MPAIAFLLRASILSAEDDLLGHWTFDAIRTYSRPGNYTILENALDILVITLSNGG